jgi:hypothetical protein
MPLIVPTPDELRAMNWQDRAKARRRLEKLLESYEGTVGSRVRLTQEQRAYRAELRRKAKAAWGERVREEARRLERESNRRAGVRR